LHASEYPGNPSRRPKLIITYTDPAPDLAAGEFAYDAQGRLIKQIFWNGVSEIRDYDHARGWLTLKKYSVDGTPVYTWFDAMYDNVGNLLSVSDGGSANAYVYDNLRQLKAFKISGVPEEAYTYDANGNLTQLGGSTFSLDLNSNQITTAEYGYVKFRAEEGGMIHPYCVIYNQMTGSGYVVPAYPQDTGF
jgi:YD repeat-containing protein